LKTRVIKVDALNPESSAIRTASKLIRAGEVVAFPTETVYGLGADATDDAAVRRIFEAKGRPSDNPVIVHISSMDELKLVTRNPSKEQLDLVSYFWPGPLTLIFQKSGNVSELVTAGLSTVAVRIPSHPVALQLIQESGRPIAAPSANLSGRPSPTTADHVFADLQGRIPIILDAGATQFGVESTVVDLSGDKPRILRPGPITSGDLAPLLGAFERAKEGSQTNKPIAPGMKYIHYAPKAPLTLVCGSPNGIADKILTLAEARCKGGLRGGILCTNETIERYPPKFMRISLGSRFYPYELARNLYSSLRSFDDRVDVIFAEGFQEVGIFEAVMNRLRKAAAEVIET
jgi:L-threonylcarbamoyladenylate synthase